MICGSVLYFVCGINQPMVNIETFKKIALSFPGTTEQPHFEKTAFRTKARIFATLDSSLQRACLKLTAIDQSVFCSIDTAVIYPVSNKWGTQGWTHAELKKITKSILKDMLSQAYALAAPIKKPQKEL